MKKAMSVLLALCLLLGLGACGNGQSSGLLETGEIAHYESCWLQEINRAIQTLGLADMDRNQNLRDVLTLSETRKIAGMDFKQELLSSTGSLDGLYGLRLTAAPMEDWREVGRAASELYAEAVEQYGEPGTYPGQEGRLSENLEMIEKNGLQSGRYTETWTVGELTEFVLELSDTEQGPTLTATYQVQTIVDGKRLTADELKARVAEKQK